MDNDNNGCLAWLVLISIIVGILNAVCACTQQPIEPVTHEYDSIPCFVTFADSLPPL